MTLYAGIPLDAPFGKPKGFHTPIKAPVPPSSKKGEVSTEKTLAKQVAKQPLSRFEELEQIINRHKEGFIEAGLALLEVRNQELYKEQGYSTFAECCEIRFGFKKTHVYRLIGASQAALALPEKERPKTENAMRKSLTISKTMSPRGDKPPPKSEPDFEATLRKVIPEKPADTASEEKDEIEEIITRIRRAIGNKNFLRALKKLLEDSGI